MITESLRHCHGIGPIRLAQLNEAGIRSWNDVIEQASQIPAGYRTTLVSAAHRALEALGQTDIEYFVEHLCPQDKWRILAEYFHQTSFFDIETSGLEIDAEVTVIICWHRGRLHTFVEHENLDEFLDLLDDVTLLASFNGASFDVPRILDAFHIPHLPCPHLDLRWPCYHAGLTGSMKRIAEDLQIQRPADLAQADGELAIRLWSDWQQHRDPAFRDHLIRYCAADVLILIMLAQHLAGVDHYESSVLWSHLPQSTLMATEQRTLDRHSLVTNLFGAASPSRLRTRRRAL